MAYSEKHPTSGEDHIGNGVGQVREFGVLALEVFQWYRSFLRSGFECDELAESRYACRDDSGVNGPRLSKVRQIRQLYS